MTSAIVSATAAGYCLRSLWHRFSAASPALAWAGAIFAGVSVLLIVPILFDPRQWHGVSTWLKPWKFQVSRTIQMLTMALFLHVLAPEARRLAGTRVLIVVAVLTATFEATYITLMGALNLGSHFNVATPVVTAMWILMGIGAVLLSLSGAALGVQIARFPLSGLSPVLRWGLSLALLTGWLLGTLTGAAMSLHGSHWVGGVASDAGGLPVFDWSRTEGDLRPPHFLGVHATQAIALVAWWLQRKSTTQSTVRQGLFATVIIAALWAIVTGIVFWLSASGKSVLPR